MGKRPMCNSDQVSSLRHHHDARIPTFRNLFLVLKGSRCREGAVGSHCHQIDAGEALYLPTICICQP